jgi:hypothetical protein
MMYVLVAWSFLGALTVLALNVVKHFVVGESLGTTSPSSALAHQARPTDGADGRRAPVVSAGFRPPRRLLNNRG